MFACVPNTNDDFKRINLKWSAAVAAFDGAGGAVKSRLIEIDTEYSVRE